MDKVEERIKKLEENQLKMAKEFSKQSVAFFFTFAGIKVGSLGEEKYKSFGKYIKDNINKANKQIDDAKNVDRVMIISAKFTDNCIEYSEAQFK